jgi:DNA-directed RNA polymerase subunit beta
MPFLEDGTPIDIILNPIGIPSRMNLGQVLETHLGWVAELLGFKALTPVFDSANETDITDGLAQIWLAQKANAFDADPNRTVAVQVERVKDWLNNKGFDGEKAFSRDFPGEATNICLRLWLEDFGISGLKLSNQELVQVVEKISREKNVAAPVTGRAILRDGISGEIFDQPVTVGNIYMMKLTHLVEDKVHARSIGPYSLITQQPLGGKAQFGGQRFGEMEVWALEAYGAAHTLQEVLTIKSDDVIGRDKTYEAIVKNEEILQPGVPESFKVLVKELQSLGLAIEVITEEEEKPLETATDTKELKEVEGENA